MPDSRPPEKYGVPRGLECPTCGRYGRLEIHGDAIRWAVGHQADCTVLASSQPAAAMTASPWPPMVAKHPAVVWPGPVRQHS